MSSHLEVVETGKVEALAFEQNLLTSTKRIMGVLDITDMCEYEKDVNGELSLRGFRECVLSRLMLIERAVVNEY
jgi:hypothetical protein